jgi:hypothetical protein
MLDYINVLEGLSTADSSCNFVKHLIIMLHEEAQRGHEVPKKKDINLTIFYQDLRNDLSRI